MSLKRIPLLINGGVVPVNSQSVAECRPLILTISIVQFINNERIGDYYLYNRPKYRRISRQGADRMPTPWVRQQ